VAKVTISEPTVSPGGGGGLAFDVPGWESFLYGSRRGGCLTESEDAVEAAVSDECSSENEAMPGEVARALGQEMYGRLYGDPDPMAEAKAQDWATTLHGVLDKLPEWEGLRDSVTGDPDLSALATSRILDVAANHLPGILQAAREERERKDAEEKGEDGDGQGEGQPGGGGGKKPGKAASLSPADKARAALRVAVKKATREAEEDREALMGLSPGLGTAGPGSMQEDTTRMELARSLRGNRYLKEILRLAGRLRRIAEEKSRQRCEHAVEQIVGTRTGADLARLTPSSLMLLASPITRPLFMRGFVEKSLLQYEVEGADPEGRGPMVVMLDTSGSMGGRPMQWACAVAIASLHVAAKDHRACTILPFQYRCWGGVYMDRSGRAWSLDIDGDTAKVGVDVGGLQGAVQQVAAWSAGGGTDFSHVLRVALDGLPAGVQDRRSDLVFVTDGQAEVSPEVQERLETMKAKMGLRVLGATVAGGSMTGAVRAICDRATDLDREGPDGGAEVIPC